MKQKRREILGYVPTFNRAIAGWSVNFIKKNIWRLHGTYDFEDLFQEAYLVFLICSKKYRYDRVENGAHFMALFKRSFSNCISDYAKKASKQREQLVQNITVIDGKEIDLFDSLEGGLSNEGKLHVAIEQAPSFVRSYIKAMESGLISGILQEEALMNLRPVKNQSLGKKKVRRILWSEGTSLDIALVTKKYVRSLTS